MDITTIGEMAAHLHRRPRTFHYAKDDYALLLLEQAALGGTTIHALKQGPFASLLAKPRVRAFLATRGGADLHADDIRRWRGEGGTPFRLTAGRWPIDAPESMQDWRRQQTTRAAYNFVLQLNFPLKHNHRLRKLVGKDIDMIGPGGHPARFDREMTLAWARIDIHASSGVALIEEIQSDWVRNVLLECEGDEWEARRWQRYRRELLEPHVRTWDEAMLAAAIHVLRERFLCHRIYMHTWQGGLQMKSMQSRWARPPRSLYTKLPRRFCFEETDLAPHFLRSSRERRIRTRLARKDVRWFLLRL